MSTQYYTVPPVPFEEAKAKLEADNEGWVITPRPKALYIAECKAHDVSKGKGGLWLLKEPRGRTFEDAEAPVGSVFFEVYCGSYRLLPELMPWIERVLDVRVMSLYGLAWEHDAGLEPKDRCGDVL